MDDDDEDFEALFFTECGELLEDLQEQLQLLSDGEGDDETVNAAFRAVHSVKGGAAAFGFNDLISFAHVFETVMDKVRSHELDLSDDVSDLLLRAGDVMVVLVERAQARSDEPVDAMQRVLDELQTYVDGGGAVESGETPAVEGEDAPTEAEVAAANDSASEADSEVDGDVVPEEEDDENLRSYEFSFSPDADFFASGHDPIRLIRAARDHGLVSVEVNGSIPSIENLDVARCPLSWVLRFETAEGQDKLWDFFAIYTSSADIEQLEAEEEEEPVNEVEETVTESKQAEAAPLEVSDSAAETEAESKVEPADPIETEVAPTPNPAPKAEAAPKPQKPPASAPAKETSARGAVQSSKSLRVELARVDRLVNLVGEMLITQAGLAQKLDIGASDDELELGHSAETLSRQLRELQENVMAIRAQPVKLVFSRMPRVVRDLSDKLDKKVRLEMFGEGTEIDTTVIEELAEPLTHMIRNSMDHGIEDEEDRVAAGKTPTGTIRLSAEHRGERVIIVVEDDGKGINREVVLKKAIERGLVSEDDTLSPQDIDGLIFHPGFSTAQEVSSVSGRGVGMDVVKKKIQSLGGRCLLTSNPGKGTRFVITLPLTLAVMDGMTVSVGAQHFILPLSAVVEAVRLKEGDAKHMPDGSTIINRRGEYLRLIELRSALSMDQGEKASDMAIIVDSETNGQVALSVDDLIGQRQVVLKSLEANYKRIDGISGATILGDGQVALILDIPSIMRMDIQKSRQEELVS